MKTVCIAALLLFGAVCAWAGNEDDFANEATAMGGTDYDSSTQIPLHTKTLTIYYQGPRSTIASVGADGGEAGSTALYQFNIKCGGDAYAEVIGNCAETGILLARLPYAVDRQQANWQLSCEITKKCAALDNLTGTFNGMGRAPTGVWGPKQLPLTTSITGGTGDFSHVIGGSITWNEGDYAKAKFLYWTKSKPYSR